MALDRGANGYGTSVPYSYLYPFFRGYRLFVSVSSRYGYGYGYYFSNLL